jgi:TRAP-type uncharacterized transport system fused permease subunit
MESHKPNPMERVMGYCAGALPLLVLIAVLFHAWVNDFAKNFLIAGAILLAASGFLARFLSRRSKNLEAAFFATRILPTDSEATKTSTDVVALVVAAALLLGALFLPLLKS